MHATRRERANIPDNVWETEGSCDMALCESTVGTWQVTPGQYSYLALLEKLLNCPAKIPTAYLSSSSVEGGKGGADRKSLVLHSGQIMARTDIGHPTPIPLSLTREKNGCCFHFGRKEGTAHGERERCTLLCFACPTHPVVAVVVWHLFRKYTSFLPSLLSTL